jgi:hypothetical protein
MVRTLKEKDIPEPWFGKKSKQATSTPAQTRAASKQMAHQQLIEDDIVEEPTAKGESMQKGKCKEDMPAKGKKKGKGRAAWDRGCGDGQIQICRARS